MTRRDILKCVHEPFGDAFYFGPERLSERYESSEEDRIESGFSNTTYKTVLDKIEREAAEVGFFPPIAMGLTHARTTLFFLIYSCCDLFLCLSK